MATIDVINQAGAVVGSIELNDAVFGIEPHQQAMYDALVMQMASRRQGTADTKGRSEVSGGGRKPYRQKGTGRARQGSIRATQFRGGGTVFGATPRNYAYRINKKVRRLFVSIIEAIQAPKKTLFVVADSEDATNVYLSARNIAGATVMSASAINTYDLVNANKVVMTSAAVKQVEEALA